MKGRIKKATRFITALLAALLSVLMSASITGCNSASPTIAATSPESSAAAPTAAPAATAMGFKDEITIDWYGSYFNYSGIVTGWMGKILKDKFNIKVNAIAPNISGQAIFQTRSAAGNLGDLIALNNYQLADTIKAGLLLDMTDLLNHYGPDLKLLSAKAVKNLQTYLETDKIYAIPDCVSNLSPTAPLPDVEGATVNTQSGGAPYLRWDVYQAVGSPKMNTMEDLLPVLQQMQQKDPVSISGKKTYAFALFKDWDGPAMKAIWESFPTMYGYEMAPGASTILVYGDPTSFLTQSLDDDNGLYYRTLKFFFNANQLGLVDPDSPSLTWDTVTTKVKDGQTLFYWWPWAAIAQYNNQTNGNADPPTGFQFVPIADQKYYDAGYNPLGPWGYTESIGSQAKDPARLMSLLNWLATPEGEEIKANGPKGLFWDVQDGKPVLTDLGKQAMADNTIQIPDSWGGGTVKDDAQCASVVDSMIYWFETDPNYNVPYQSTLWPSVMDSAATKLDKSWQDAMGAENMIDYCLKNNMLSIAPGNGYVPPTDSGDIKNARAQCSKVVTDASWQMVFAKDQAAFDSIWADMKAQLKGLGWDDVYSVDMQIAKDYNAACLKSIADSK